MLLPEPLFNTLATEVLTGKSTELHSLGGTTIQQGFSYFSMLNLDIE